MTPNQIKKYEKLRIESIRASEAFHKYKDELTVTCSHPEQYVQIFQWEHDDGYGRQTMHTGKTCVICYAKKFYSHSDWAKRGEK